MDNLRILTSKDMLQTGMSFYSAAGNLKVRSIFDNMNRFQTHLAGSMGSCLRYYYIVGSTDKFRCCIVGNKDKSRTCTVGSKGMFQSCISGSKGMEKTLSSDSKNMFLNLSTDSRDKSTLFPVVLVVHNYSNSCIFDC